MLRALLPTLAPHLRCAFVDSRFAAEAVALVPGVPLRLVAPNVGSRVRGLIALSDAARPEDRLFCFNNAPPLIRSRAWTILCIRSPFLVPGAEHVRWPVRARLRLAFERMLLRAGSAHVDEFWVQTPRMADAFAPAARGRPVHVRPFFDLPLPPAPPRATLRDVGAMIFFYPAAGYSYKGHAALFAAWGLLARSGVRPRLEVTLRAREFARIVDAEMMAGTRADIVNLGPLARADALAKVRAADAMIFPSSAESFGIPLLEAAAFGTPVLASELRYVRDVCIPAQTFDAADAGSIADAVLRFIGQPRAPVRPLDAAAFVDAILLSGP